MSKSFCYCMLGRFQYKDRLARADYFLGPWEPSCALDSKVRRQGLGKFDYIRLLHSGRDHVQDQMGRLAKCAGNFNHDTGPENVLLVDPGDDDLVVASSDRE